MSVSVPSGGWGTAASATSGNCTPGYPSVSGGILANDIILCFVVSRDNVASTISGSFTTKQETNTGTGCRATLFWKRAAGSESGTETVTHTAGAAIIAAMVVLRGAYTSGDPFDGIGSFPASEDASTPVVGAAVTPTYQDGWLGVFAYGVRSSSGTLGAFAAETGYTAQTQQAGGASGNRVGFRFYEDDTPPNGGQSSGTVSIDWTGTFTPTTGCIQFMLRTAPVALSGTQVESANASYDADYTHASTGGSVSDEQSDSATTSDIPAFRLEATLYFPVETATATDSSTADRVQGGHDSEVVTATESHVSLQKSSAFEVESTSATDDAGYAYQAAAVGNQYQDDEVDSVPAVESQVGQQQAKSYQDDSATATDSQVAAQQDRSFEIESATATEAAGSLQRHQAGWEEDDTVASDVQVSRQAATPSQLDTTSASEQAASRQQALSTETEQTTTSDDAAYTYQAASGAFLDEQVESTAASESIKALQAGSSSEAETASGSDDAAFSWAGTDTFERDELESATASEEAPYRLEAILYFPVESVTASDNAAYTFAGSSQVYQDGEAESATADFSAAYTFAAASHVYEDAEIESVTGSLDAPFALEAELEVPDEIATATDSQVATQGDKSSEVESTNASDNASYTWAGAGGTLFLEGQSDSSTATDPQTAQQTGAAFQGDSAVATLTFQGYAQSADAALESIAATDDAAFTLAHAGLLDDEVETATATDAYAYAMQGSAAQVESATLSDRQTSAVPVPTFANSFFVWNGAGWV